LSKLFLTGDQKIEFPNIETGDQNNCFTQDWDYFKTISKLCTRSKVTFYTRLKDLKDPRGKLWFG
jgi:hypothetical protein